MMSAKQMKTIRNIIMGATVVIGFICWLAMPYEFKNTGLFHVGSGEYGTKPCALILLLFPLFALIPDKENSEVHTDDPSEREKLIKKYELKEAKRQLLTAIYVGITVVAILGIAALVL